MGIKRPMVRRPFVSRAGGARSRLVDRARPGRPYRVLGLRRSRPSDSNRDTSATAIAAASLLKLSALSRDERKRQAWRSAAEATVRALVERHLGEEGGLWDGCFNKRIGLATRHELIWGTYYLFEALHVLAGRLEPSRI